MPVLSFAPLLSRMRRDMGRVEAGLGGYQGNEEEGKVGGGKGGVGDIDRRGKW